MHEERSTQFVVVSLNLSTHRFGGLLHRLITRRVVVLGEKHTAHDVEQSSELVAVHGALDLGNVELHGRANGADGGNVCTTRSGKRGQELSSDINTAY